MYNYSNLFLKYLSCIFSVLSAILFTTSCIPPDVKGTAEIQFFDLKGFLDAQIVSLEKGKVTVIKKTMLQGKTAERKIKKMNWKDEFAFFYASDINTPQLRDSYKIEKTFQKWIFKAEEENLLVQEMQITFNKDNKQNDFEDVKEIVILQEDKNNLYENYRTLNVKVGEGVIKTYSIKGSEDVIMNEKQEFLVEGVVQQ